MSEQIVAGQWKLLYDLHEISPVLRKRKVTRKLGLIIERSTIRLSPDWPK
jgi:putative heme degradation protein